MLRDMQAVLIRKLGEASVPAASTHPTDTTNAWVKVTLLDARDMTGLEVTEDRLIEYMIQVDCYAGKDNSTVDTYAVVQQVRSSLRELEGVTYDEAVVSRVRFASGPTQLPDTAFRPARERYQLTTLVRAR